MNKPAKSGSALLIVVCFILAMVNVLAVSFLVATGSRARIARRQLAMEGGRLPPSFGQFLV